MTKVGRFRVLWSLVVGCGALALLPGAARAAEDAAGLRFFEEKVRPLLHDQCIKCHGGEKTRGGLRLTGRDALLAGGDSGPGAVIGQPDQSLLLKAISYKNDKLQMPPKGKLSQEQIDILTKWVEMGLPGPAGDAGAAEPAGHGVPKVDDKARQFWSFKPLARPDVPAVKDSAWVRNPIDAFILSKLDQKNFTPAPQADKITLIRRATYDLTGLPPTLSEVDAFVKDTSPDAYEKLIDRLLASPHYGEKWGRHWLDLVRFAETNSYERDGRKPNAWRYRDYVIRSFNQDKPYDRFVKEQLAGDELPDAATNPDAIIATGFYRLGIWDDEPVDREQARYDGLDDLVATVGQVFLGLTIDCARCHDHKIDPIPQRDYYKLVAFFQNINDYKNGGPTDEVTIATNANDRAAIEQSAKEYRQRYEAARERVREIERDFRQQLSGEPGRGEISYRDAQRLIRSEGERVLGPDRFARYKKYQADFEVIRQTRPDVQRALAVTERGPVAPDTFLLIRGGAHSPGAKVEPGFLEVLEPKDPVIPTPSTDAMTSGRRTVLADWITSKDNPLPARVMVNRIWQYHFGRGIVRSSSNFGYQGDAPTHPELLEWLATEFQARGWSMKQMHRLIMTSNTYRMSSRADEKALAADPRNDLQWRFDMRRLTAEEIRDSILAANGTLNLTMYGASTFPYIPREVMLGQSRPGEGWEKNTPEEQARRSVYIHVKRSLRVPIIESLDGAETDKSCPVRFVTVQPTQALGMLNGEFLNGEAQKLADLLNKQAGDDVAKQLALGFRRITSREPTKEEVDRGVALYKTLIEKDGATPEQAMKYVCLVALNLNEFVYLD